jgi:sugar phosphate isomerase/epimerase
MPTAMCNTSSRRTFLRQAAAAATLAILPQSLLAAPRHKIGVATLGFGELTNAELAKELSATGIKLIQLFLNQKDSKFWKYNDRVDVSSLTAARCREIAAPYRDAGIEIHSLGVYTNLIHPVEAERKANLAFFEAMMAVGGQMNVRTFITEAGHYHDPKATVPVEFQDAVWTQMVATGRQLAEMAAKHDAKVLMEPAHWSFFTSAKRLRTYLEAVNSPRIRALLDAANIIEVNDLDEMFRQLTPWIDCIHAKDRKLHVQRGVAAGKGDIDYKQFVSLAAKHTPNAPLVLEYVGTKDYKDALAHLRRAMAEL